MELVAKHEIEVSHVLNDAVHNLAGFINREEVFIGGIVFGPFAGVNGTLGECHNAVKRSSKLVGKGHE